MSYNNVNMMCSASSYNGFPYSNLSKNVRINETKSCEIRSHEIKVFKYILLIKGNLVDVWL